ncbi:hypothetical protein WN944_026089 [Citrus x changshan-huyou]|uniref:Uncharacterized protein n=1 Tax=Citrus x changshan-huyou TaxID=2935761 RepID=A0AAP0LRF2_9ROSI
MPQQKDDKLSVEESSGTFFSSKSSIGGQRKVKITRRGFDTHTDTESGAEVICNDIEPCRGERNRELQRRDMVRHEGITGRGDRMREDVAIRGYR